MNKFWLGVDGDEATRDLYDTTTRILELCEGHYTVWYSLSRQMASPPLFFRHHRRRLVQRLGLGLTEELSFIRQYTVETPKNYQLWQAAASPSPCRPNHLGTIEKSS